jgi:molybdate transport system permease protein
VSSGDLIALWLSLRLAITTTLLLLVLCLPLAWWLAMGRSRLRLVVDALVSLPLVLPPTVLGFYLLLLLSPRSALGTGLHALGLPAPAFTFTGLVIGSVIYSLPFAAQPLRDSFQAMGTRALEAAAMLRASPWDRFISIALPLSARGLLTAAVLSFAHTLGEFGVVLMIGGNIPGRTETASIALFNHAEALEYGAAYRLSLLLLAACFALLLVVYASNRRLRASGAPI